MANIRALLTLAWRSTVKRWSTYTLGAALVVIFWSALLSAACSTGEPFLTRVRNCVFVNAIPMAGLALALFLEELWRTPARMRVHAANGALELHTQITRADFLQRTARRVQGGVEGYLAVRARNDTVAEQTVRMRLGEDWESLRSIATNGTMLHGSWLRRRRARRLCDQFGDTYWDHPERLLEAIKTFTGSY